MHAYAVAALGRSRSRSRGDLLDLKTCRSNRWRHGSGGGSSTGVDEVRGRLGKLRAGCEDKERQPAKEPRTMDSKQRNGTVGWDGLVALVAHGAGGP
jgi:hypothetical protein